VPDSGDGGEVSVAGRLLVAGPALFDPNFARTVILMLEHDAAGAVGVVLNRPTKAELSEHLPSWWLFAAEPRVVFIGGPVGEGGGLGLARGHGGAVLEGWSEVAGLRALDLEMEPDVDDELEVRIFAGYAGWSPGQLEGELVSGSWIVVDAEGDDVFTAEPDRLWSSVLRRQGGRLSLLATMPIDPSLN
jgi:putative transcriptional regulator